MSQTSIVTLALVAMACGAAPQSQSQAPVPLPDEQPAAAADSPAAEIAETAATPAAADSAVASDAATRVTLPTASFIRPEGYEVSSDKETAALLAGPGGIVFVTEDEVPPTVTDLEQCYRFAHGVAGGFLAGILERPNLQVAIVERSAYGDGGCYAALAPSEGRPAVFRVTAVRYGARFVVVMCSVGDEPQTLACDGVRASLAAR